MQLHNGGIGQSIAKHKMKEKTLQNHTKMFAGIHDTSLYYIIMTLWFLKRAPEAPSMVGPEAQKSGLFGVPKNTAVVPFTPKAGIRKCIIGALMVNTCRPLIFGTSSPWLMRIAWPGCLEWSGYDGDSDLCNGVSKGSPRRHSVNMAKRGVPWSVEALVCRASLHVSWVDRR